MIYLIHFSLCIPSASAALVAHPEFLLPVGWSVRHEIILVLLRPPTLDYPNNTKNYLEWSKALYIPMVVPWWEDKKDTARRSGARVELLSAHRSSIIDNHPFAHLIVILYVVPLSVMCVKTASPNRYLDHSCTPSGFRRTNGVYW